MPLAVLAALLGLIALVGLLRLLRRKAGLPPRPVLPYILVDGSNVMHWKDEKPDLSSVLAVVRMLEAQGFAPGVVFDANAGWKLENRYLHERDFAKLLHLPKGQIFVVPKGTQADPYLLSAARDHGAKVVSRDRFRDWAAEYPEVVKPGFLVRGGYRNSGELWLDDAVSAKSLLNG